MRAYSFLWIGFAMMFLSVSPANPVHAAGPFVHKGRRPCPSPRLKQYVLPEVSLISEGSLEGWTTLGGKTPPPAWKNEDGVIHLDGKGGDIITDRDYKDFILDFAWTHSPGGNSGIKYRLKQFEGKGWRGCEYQILDDFNSKEGMKPKNSAATLYDLFAISGEKRLNPHDEINYGRIVVNGNRIQHWLNGEKVLDVVVGSRQWREAVAASKFKNLAGFGENRVGRLMLQDHRCEVWFHQISVREIQTIAYTSRGRKTSGVFHNHRHGKRIMHGTSPFGNRVFKPTPVQQRSYRQAVSRPRR